MIESPVLRELLQERERETLQQAALDVLQRRFGAVPEDLAAWVRAVQDSDRLRELLGLAVDCPDLDAFRAALA
jgi:hypothetical protein